MQGSRKLFSALVAALVVACCAPALSAAAPGGETLSAAQAVARTCDARHFASGAPGVARTSWTAPARGLLTVSLSGGPEGDWDLAAFRRPGSAADAASTAFGSDEQLTIAVNPGDRLAVQACRRSGGPAAVPLDFDLYEMSADRQADPRISLESVAVSGPEEIDRLERLGFDVTHDVSQEAATVVLYSARERARLAAAGFSATTLIPDLAAEDAADRRSEGLATRVAAGSALPSGRESYRVYNDYTSQMKALAENNPRLVRPVVLGRTFEDRPIQGVEIATDVKRTDDGRPVYLNFGLHHAREWPSGELPMEFALDLVRRFRDGNARVRSLLDRVRVIIVPGEGAVRRKVSVDRGERVEANWARACGGEGGLRPPRASGPLCMGTEVTIAGTPRSERLVGTAGRDVFFARRGDDRVAGRGGNDVICTGRGADRARGAKGRDSIAAWRGPDRLRGGPGRDDLLGGPGRDRLVGGTGQDRCRGGRKPDTVRGCP